MKTALKTGFFVAMLMTAAPAFSQVYVGLGIRIGPPPVRKEVVVACPHPGWVWVAGYWRWRARAHRYLWVKGYWVRPPRPYAVWVAPRWEQRHGEWIFFRGRWR